MENADKPESKEQLMRRARELLTLDPLPRELAVLLIDKIEIGQKTQKNGTQSVNIYWKF